MKQCAFCDSTARLSGEHVWSNWIVELLGSETTGFNFRYRDTETGLIKEWSAPTMHQKTNVVCKRCNQTWMSDIESSARLTLSNIIRDGAPVSLLNQGITSLATYAFKCAVVANHMSFESSQPFFPSRVRYRFRETLQIPDGVFMWLAHFRGRAKYSGRFSALYGNPKLEQFRHLGFYIFTFVAGRLAFQVFACRWAKLHRAEKRFPGVVHPDRELWDGAAVQFWPRDGFPVVWPPKLYLGDDTLDQFRDRWEHTSVVV